MNVERLPIRCQRIYKMVNMVQLIGPEKRGEVAWRRFLGVVGIVGYLHFTEGA